MKKLLSVLMLLSFVPFAFGGVAPDIRISDNSGNVLNINSDGTVPVSGGGGGGGASGTLDLSVVYPDGNKIGAHSVLTSNLITYNGNQYAGFVNSSLNLVMAKRATDSNSWSFVVYDGAPKAPVFTGTGLNDALSGGTATIGITTTATYDVEIDSTGATDTFKWRVNGGAYTTGVNCAVTATTLSNGITVVFGAITGHTLGDKWSITVNPKLNFVGDIHEGVNLQFDDTGILHIDFGSYVTAGGLNYRRFLAAESIDGISAEQQISATYDAQASYFTFIKVGNKLYSFYRSNGASGSADEFLWLYDSGTTTWSRAPGTSSAGVVGRFIDGVNSTRSAYMAWPKVNGTDIWFLWSWQLNILSYGAARETAFSVVRYDTVNGTFKKADGSAQTMPITLSNSDKVWSEPGPFYQGAETMAYRHAIDIDENGHPNVVYSKHSGADHSVTFSGSGTNDLVIDYQHPVTGYEAQPRYEIVVSSTATPNQFKYRINGGAFVSLNNMTQGYATLPGGLRIGFGAVTGHTLNDTWVIYPPTGYNQVWRTYHNGTSWQTPLQLTNNFAPQDQGDMQTWGQGIRHNANLYINGNKKYVIYGSISEGEGILVKETTDWQNFKFYSILPGGQNLYTDIALATIDPERWNTEHIFSFLFQFNHGGLTAGIANSSQSPIYIMKWDPATSAGFKVQPLKSHINYGDYFHGSMEGSDTTVGTARFALQHVFWAQNVDDLNYLISNRTVNGDTIYLASATYLIHDTINITKQVALVGQGIGKTILSTSDAVNQLINITASNVSVRNLSISSTAAGTFRGINVNGTGVSGGSFYTGTRIENVGITMSGTGSQICIEFQDAGATVVNPYCNITSSNGAAIGIWTIGASTQDIATTLDIYSPYVITSSAAGTGESLKIQSSTSPTTVTGNVYGGYFAGLGAAGTRHGAEVNGGANAILNLYKTTLVGTTYDIASSSASSTANLYDVTLVNNLVLATGTINYLGAVKAGSFQGAHYSSDGTAGMTGSCAAATTATVKDGLVTACA